MSEEILGKVIDGYQVAERIKAGGMAVVYKAKDLNSNEDVALKLLQSSWAEHPEVVSRFAREAHIMKELKHPYVVQYRADGIYDNRPYIVMDYLSGGSLSDLLKQVAHINLKATALLLRQIASALDYAHKRGIVHRDLKPGNILLLDRTHSALTDFGIARVHDHTQLTRMGEMPGTPQYMSPEQASGLIDELDKLSDVYSLGIIAFLLATGKLPFTGSDPMVILNLHLTKKTPTPTDINPELPPEVDEVLFKALEKKKEDRYQSTGEFAKAFQRAVRDHGKVEVIIATRRKPNTVEQEDGSLVIFSDSASVIDVPIDTSESLLPRIQRQQRIQRITIGVVGALLAIIFFIILTIANNQENNRDANTTSTARAIALAASETEVGVQAEQTADLTFTFEAEQTIIRATEVAPATQTAQSNIARTEAAQEVADIATQTATIVNQTETAVANNLTETAIPSNRTATAEIRQASQTAQVIMDSTETAVVGTATQQQISIDQTELAVVVNASSTASSNNRTATANAANVTATARAIEATQVANATNVIATAQAIEATQTANIVTGTAVAIINATENAQIARTEAAQEVTQTANAASPTATLTPSLTITLDATQEYMPESLNTLLDDLAPANIGTVNSFDCGAFNLAYNFLVEDAESARAISPFRVAWVLIDEPIDPMNVIGEECNGRDNIISLQNQPSYQNLRTNVNTIRDLND